ncbi:MAG: tyrosine-type recombinase/integrase, partial [Actinomycetota bacterium]
PEVRPGLALGPAKTGRSRTLLIPHFLAEMLREHVATYPPTPDGFVFTASEGGPVWHRNFYGRHFKPAVHRARLPEGLRFHDLRHTCAALLIDAGRHLEEVKQYLGHSSIRVTSDRYGHLFPTGREAMRDGLDRSFELARKPRSDRDVDEMLTADSEMRDSPAGPGAD